MYGVRYLEDLLETNYRVPGLKRLQCRHWVKKHCFRLVTCLYRHELIPSHQPVCSYVERGTVCPLHKCSNCFFSHRSTSEVPTEPLAHGSTSLISEYQMKLKELACNVNPIDCHDRRSILETILYSDIDLANLGTDGNALNLSILDFPLRNTSMT